MVVQKTNYPTLFGSFVLFHPRIFLRTLFDFCKFRHILSIVQRAGFTHKQTLCFLISLNVRKIFFSAASFMFYHAHTQTGRNHQKVWWRLLVMIKFEISIRKMLPPCELLRAEPCMKIGKVSSNTFFSHQLQWSCRSKGCDSSIWTAVNFYHQQELMKTYKHALYSFQVEVTWMLTDCLAQTLPCRNRVLLV